MFSCSILTGLHGRNLIERAMSLLLNKTVFKKDLLHSTLDLVAVNLVVYLDLVAIALLTILESM